MLIDNYLNQIKSPPKSSIFSPYPDGSLRFIDVKYFGGQKYDINLKGYRNDFEFDDIKYQKINLFFGCSHTFGVGLEKNDIYFNHIPKNENTINVNMGIPGAGIQEISYCIAGAINFFKNIEKIYLYHPYIGMRPYSYEYNQSGNLGYQLKNCNEKVCRLFLSEKLNKDLDLLLISEWKIILQNFVFNIDQMDTKDLLDTAKDKEHWGPITHKNLAKKFI